MTYEEAGRRLKRIRASIADRFANAPGRPLQSIGLGNHAVVVRLKPDAISVAEELNRDFGSMVEITVGFKTFPGGNPCIPLPRTLEALDTIPMIHVMCDIDTAHLHGGDTAAGKVILQNTGPSRIDLSATASAGWLCRPATLAVVGGYSGLIADAGHVFHITPHGSETLNFVVGTASCEPGTRYVVQPGNYEIVVPVDLMVEGTQSTARSLARGRFIEIT